MHRFIPDRFVLMLLSVLVAAWLLPLRGGLEDAAQSVIYAGIFALFFLHGLRLPRREVAQAAMAWRLQGAMLGFCFIAMPLAGWGIATLVAPALPPALLAGIIYLAVLPSTVQSAISYTAIGGGNVAASAVGAALSNLAGIILTPLLVLMLLGSSALSLSGITLDSGVIIRIAVMLLLPFALGQLAQGWLGSWAAQQKPLLALFDRAVILMAVYIAFSGAAASGAMMQLDKWMLTALAMTLLLLLCIAFGGAMLLGGAMGLPRGDRISLIFAGAHKSIATGAPMAALLFGDAAGLIILPAILYHMAQLVLSVPLANRMARGVNGQLIEK
jgi:solute carrier family 10 (sodium/bile acid cotransporter), member 7